jgi:hypothetical protein
MKFSFQFKNEFKKINLFYLKDEYSFYSESQIKGIDCYLALNYLCLVVVRGFVVEVSGFCPHKSWIRSNTCVPDFRAGKLSLLNAFDTGFSYGINDDEDWPIYINAQTGWLCVGDPIVSGIAVEFTKVCVAVIGDQQDFLALWLKPQNFPGEYHEILRLDPVLIKVVKAIFRCF